MSGQDDLFGPTLDELHTSSPWTNPVPLVQGPQLKLDCARCGKTRPHADLGAKAQCGGCGKIVSRP